MLSTVIRRTLGDLAGAITLAALTAMIAAFAYRFVGGTLTGVSFAVYAVLVVPGYLYWVGMEKSGRNPQWVLQSVSSVGVGALSLIVDAGVGYLLHGPESVLAAAASTGIMFGFTLLVCPGFTAIALAGWSRSLVMRVGTGTAGQEVL
jgi:hypothetical protein